MPTADGQYHTDEFIGEVIGIAHLRRIHIDMPERNGGPVALTVCFDHEHEGWTPFTSMGEKTLGFALADVRQQIRERWGR